MLRLICFTLAVSKPLAAAPTGGGSAASSDALMKNLIVTATYGVVSGALVGLATLAFSKNPTDNLRNVAKGGSIGLYIGLGLGLYISFAKDINKSDGAKAPTENKSGPAGDSFDLFDGAIDPKQYAPNADTNLYAFQITPMYTRIGLPNMIVQQETLWDNSISILTVSTPLIYYRW